MGQYISTVVVEPLSLVREALVSLMASHSYPVAGSFASAAEIKDDLLVKEAPSLVILGASPGEEAASAAGSIRKLWSDTKIVLLFDHGTLEDFQKLLASEIDGCIPLWASPDTLVGTIQQIIAADLKILVLKSETSSIPYPTNQQQEDDELGAAPSNPAKGDDLKDSAIDRTASLRIVHGLSQREEEILRSVVRGHSNKMIARTCGVTDATIKVHMKSILRKIRVANRTQAAIWAIGQGYGADSNPPSSLLRPVNGSAAA